MNQKNNFSVSAFLIKMIQGAFVGFGFVLPGLSGGVLCVVFGIYKTIMEFLADPFGKFKTHFPKLLPVGIGGIIGILGISKLLGVLLENFEAPSVCVFIGLIVGMLPSLFREAGQQGRNKNSFVSLVIATIFTLALLGSLLFVLNRYQITIEPNFGWNMFAGFCLALSVIVPGMSSNTLLMPLGLYDKFIAALGDLNFAVIIPAGIGILVTVILLSKAVNKLFERHYSIAFHAIIGIVIAATIMIIPAEEAIQLSFVASVSSAIINVICIAAGIAAALLLDKFNQKYAA